MPVSNELKQAVNHVLSHAQGLRATLTLAEAINDIVKLEALAGEAEARRTKAEAELKATEDVAIKAITTANEKLAEAVAATVGVADAKEQAKRLLSDATATAHDTIKSAEAQAENLRREAEAALGLAKAGMDIEIEARKADLATLDDGIKVKLEEIEALEKRAAKAKKYLEKLVEA